MFFNRRLNKALDFIRETVEQSSDLWLKSITFRITDKGQEVVIEAVSNHLQDKGDQTETKQTVIVDGFGGDSPAR